MHSISGSSPKRLRRRHVGLDRFRQQSRRDAPRLRRKTRAPRKEDGGRSSEDRWINPETFRMAIAVFRSKTSWERFDPRRGPGDAFPHPQQCRHTICREGARLEDLHSCRYPPGRRFRQEEIRFLGYVVFSQGVLTLIGSSRLLPALHPRAARLPRHSPRCSGRAHRQTHQLARPRLWLSMMGLMVVVVVASRSKA